MRPPEIITSEIQHLDSICSNAEKLTFQFPDDNVLKLTFEQLLFRKTTLLEELESSLLFFDKYSLKDN
jgi:hypothetical protein